MLAPTGAGSGFSAGTQRHGAITMEVNEFSCRGCSARCHVDVIATIAGRAARNSKDDVQNVIGRR